MCPCEIHETGEDMLFILELEIKEHRVACNCQSVFVNCREGHMSAPLGFFYACFSSSECTVEWISVLLC